MVGVWEGEKEEERSEALEAFGGGIMGGGVTGVPASPLWVCQ